MQTTTVDEKPMALVEHAEDKLDLSDQKAFQTIDQLDRFGSHAKIDPVEIALVRKLDIHMMVRILHCAKTCSSLEKISGIWRHLQPILWLMYFLNFLDRNAIVNGKLNGLSGDLKLKGTQYNTLVSILFVGYLLGQVPSNMILNRVKPAWFMAGLLWPRVPASCSSFADLCL